MDFMTALDIGASGLAAERTSINIISMNLANVNTTRTPSGGPYVRKVPIFQEKLMEAMKGAPSSSGVRVAEIAKDPLPPRMVYQPDHPDANAEGYVAYPNVNVVREMADMLVASRAYEASVNVVETGKALWTSALEIMRS